MTVTIVVGCTEPGCGATFTTTEAAVRHMERTGHLGQRPDWARPTSDPTEADPAYAEAVREDEAARDWEGVA